MNNNRIGLAFKKSAITVTFVGENAVELSHIGFEDKKIIKHLVKFSDLKRVLYNEDIEVRNEHDEISSINITKDDTRNLKIRIGSIDELNKITLTGYCSIQDYVTFIKGIHYLINGKEVKSFPVTIGTMNYNLSSIEVGTIFYLLKNGVIGQGFRRDTIYSKHILSKVDGEPNRYTGFDINAKDEKILCTISSGNVREDCINGQSAYILDKPEEFAEKCFNNKHEVINFIAELCIIK